ncbi:MAG: cytochrome c oxidase assembly protein, partial [Acidimicrobiales bacterium]
MALAYVRGWLILRWKGYPSAACWPRLIASLFGWGIVAVALLSPLDALAQLRLSMHMIQHELLMVVAPPLLLLGRPLAVALWGLPAGARSWAAQSLRRRAPLRRAFDRLTSPLVAWGVSTAVLWAWHIPAAYDAVEANGLLHDAQHVCFFASGLLFWWPIIG